MRDRCWLWRWMICLARPTVSPLAPGKPIRAEALLMADSAALMAYFCAGDFRQAQAHAERIDATYSVA